MVKTYKTRKDMINIIDQKFADLTVIGFAGKGKYRGATWHCKCICGKEIIVPGGHLRAGMRLSCGCRSQSRIFTTGINRVYSNYKRKAHLRNHEFSLSWDEFKALITSNCYYCNRAPHQELKRLKTKKVQIMYNGIDRFDPNVGYISGNCVSCCYYCNHAKADLTFDQWKIQLKRIVQWLKLTDFI